MGRGTLLNVTYYGIDGDPVTTHLMAAEIVPGGQAKAIGLEPGDTILSYDGKAGLNSATLIRAVQVPGEGTRELRILRRGEVLTFQVQPGKLGIRPWTAPCKVKRRQAPDPFGSRREKGTSLNCAQQNRNLGEEEGTSEGNLVALA